MASTPRRKPFVTRRTGRRSARPPPQPRRAAPRSRHHVRHRLVDDVVATQLAARPRWVHDGRNAGSQPAGGEWIARVKVIDVDGIQRRAVLVPVENARRWLMEDRSMTR